MKLWDNTTSCAGDCEQVCTDKGLTFLYQNIFQRFFLSDKRGPPLVPVTLEGTGEVCEKCPCGQKCMYVHQETSQNIVRGLFVFLFPCFIIIVLLGSHLTPVIRYVDDISFTVLEGDEASCRLKGHSFSTVSILSICSTVLLFLCRAQHGMTSLQTTAT